MVSKPEGAVDLKYRVAMASIPARYYARMTPARTEVADRARAFRTSPTSIRVTGH